MEKNKEVEKGQEMHAHMPKQNSASKRKEQLRVTANTAQWLKAWALEPEFLGSNLPLPYQPNGATNGHYHMGLVHLSSASVHFI